MNMINCSAGAALCFRCGFRHKSGLSVNMADWKRLRSSGLCLASVKKMLPVVLNCPACAYI